MGDVGEGKNCGGAWKIMGELKNSWGAQKIHGGAQKIHGGAQKIHGGAISWGLLQRGVKYYTSTNPTWFMKLGNVRSFFCDQLANFGR